MAKQRVCESPWNGPIAFDGVSIKSFAFTDLLK
jgi:hypothetical protein